MSVSGFSVQLAGKGERVLERALCVFQFCPQRGNIFFQEIFFFHAFLSDEVQFSISSHCAGKAGKSPKLLCFAKWAADCCFSSFLRFVTISAIIFPEVWVKCIIFYFYYLCWFFLVVKKKTKKKTKHRNAQSCCMSLLFQLISYKNSHKTWMEVWDHFCCCCCCEDILGLNKKTFC